MFSNLKFYDFPGTLTLFLKYLFCVYVHVSYEFMCICVFGCPWKLEEGRKATWSWSYSIQLCEPEVIGFKLMTEH